MKITNKYSLGIILSVAMFAAPLVIVWLFYGQSLAFNPAEFSKQYLQFLFSLISMGTGFTLANIIWVKKTNSEKSERERKILLRFFRFINNLAQQGLGILNANYRDSNLGQVEDNDRSLRESFKVMALAKQGILLHYPENEIAQEPNLTELLVVNFWQEVAPIIDRLSIVDQIRGHTLELKEELEKLKTVTEKVIQALSSKTGS